MAVTQVPKNAVVKLFEEIGITTAAKWNLKRMAAKLAKIDQMVDDDSLIVSAEAGTVYNQCIKAIEAGDEIEIVEPPLDDPPADPPKEPTSEDPPVEDPPADPPRKRGRPKKTTEDPPTEPPRKRGRPKKTTEDPPADPPRKRGRPRKSVEDSTQPETLAAPTISCMSSDEIAAFYVAGTVLKKHSRIDGISDDMVADFEAEFKARVPRRKHECRPLHMLTCAWYVLNGFNSVPKN